ncbi:hypothetical protein H8356DRAFT_1352602 [Neocallimastix lanati (nom. inval.)]|nr:hypothetical protein H8356DRAFT_1352602 [Neocallimastix sp. JGI-2020a]
MMLNFVNTIYELCSIIWNDSVSSNNNKKKKKIHSLKNYVFLKIDESYEIKKKASEILKELTNYIIKIIPKESENEEFKSEEYVFRRFKENFKNFKIFINKFNEKYYHNKELMKNTIMHIIKEIRLFNELFNDNIFKGKNYSKIKLKNYSNIKDKIKSLGKNIRKCFIRSDEQEQKQEQEQEQEQE